MLDCLTGLNVVCAFVYIAIITFTHKTVNYAGDGYYGGLALSLTLSGLIWFVWLSKHITVNSRCLQFIGANTLIYFCLHKPLLQVVEQIMNKVLLNIGITLSIWINIMEVVIIAALLAIPAWIINRYIPQVTGKGWKLWKV